MELSSSKPRGGDNIFLPYGGKNDVCDVQILFPFVLLIEFDRFKSESKSEISLPALIVVSHNCSGRR